MGGDGVGQGLLHRRLEVKVDRGVEAAGHFRLAVLQHLDDVAGGVDDAQDAAARAVEVLLAPRLQPGQAD